MTHQWCDSGEMELIFRETGSPRFNVCRTVHQDPELPKSLFPSLTAPYSASTDLSPSTDFSIPPSLM